jgi:predicted aldo/keto reductase-like oxidoreductase
MPCPAGVDIPTCFSCYNEKYMLKKGHPRIAYMQNTGVMSSHPGYASLCKKCGKCEQHCPQGIPIRQKLHEVSREMEGVFFLPMVGVSSLIFHTKRERKPK